MKIIAIGRNYAEHAKELNHPVPDEPVFFTMPETALLLKNQPFFYPDFSQDVHYEVELVVKISRLGKHIEERFAHRYYDKVSVGIDFTARDIQKQLKEKGLPWEKAKAFDGAAPVGKFIAKEDLPAADNITFSLQKNGETVQVGNTKDMLFSIDALIAHVSKYFMLKIGDLIFTGTPAGVGPVQIGDDLRAFIGEKELLKVQVK